MFKKAHLENGITVLMERLGNMHSVCLGIWVRVGSRSEPTPKNGISHFLEHMFFKGTRKRSAQEIAFAIDSMGGDLNAFTSKESTTFYIKVLDDYLDRGIELISDVFLHSTFPEEDVEKEKGVIKEEIKLVEDTPDDYVHDLFSQAVWGETGLGQPILGRRETIKAISRNDLMEHVKIYYGTKNIVISCAGKFEPEAVLEMLNRYMGGLKAGDIQAGSAGSAVFHPRTALHERQHSEVHLCIGVQGIPQASEDRYRLSVLNAILGAGVSSRLFQEIREKRGLVYSIQSFLSSYLDTGLWGIYAGTGRKNLSTVIDLIVGELRRLPETITTSELDRAKQQLKGNLILALESTSSRMHNIARQEIYYGRYYSAEDIIKEIDSLSLSDVKGIAERLLKAKGLALTVLGPVDKSHLKPTSVFL